MNEERSLDTLLSTPSVGASDDNMELADDNTASILNLLTKDSTGVDSETIMSSSVRSNLSTDGGEDGTQAETSTRAATRDVMFERPAVLQDIEQQLASLAVLSTSNIVTENEFRASRVHENVNTKAQENLNTKRSTSDSAHSSPAISNSIEDPAINEEAHPTSTILLQSTEESATTSDSHNAQFAGTAISIEHLQYSPTSSHFTHQLGGFMAQQSGKGTGDIIDIEKSSEDHATGDISIESGATLLSVGSKTLQEVIKMHQYATTIRNHASRSDFLVNFRAGH